MEIIRSLVVIILVIGGVGITLIGAHLDSLQFDVNVQTHIELIEGNACGYCGSSLTIEMDVCGTCGAPK